MRSHPKNHRAAFSIVEVTIGMAILVMLLAVTHSFHIGATKSAAITGEHSEALRSVVVALESIRRDLEQMIYQCPSRDLALLNHPELGDNRGLSVRVSDGSISSDSWRATFVPVSYALRRVAGSSHAYHLVRTDTNSGKETVLKSCLLRDMLIRHVPLKDGGGKGLSPYQAYLEITMIGLGSLNGQDSYTASMVVPLALMYPAMAYTVKASGQGK